MIAIAEDTLPRLSFASEVSRFTLRCDSVAWMNGEFWSDPRTLLTLSVVGADTAIKAVRAMLLAPTLDVRIRYLAYPGDEKSVSIQMPRTTARRCASWDSAVARLGRGAIHLVAHAKIEGLLPDVSDDSLWAELMSERYSTPLLRRWLPWLREELKSSGLLREAEGHNQAAGVLSATTDDLDALVSDGIKCGALVLDE